jgi:sugar lactone lactonase YvrE
MHPLCRLARFAAIALAVAALSSVRVSAHPPVAEPAQPFASGIAGPEGLAFTRKGTLIVGSTTGEIRRYVPSGAFDVLANVGDRLAGITVLRDGRVLALGFNNGRVWSIDPSGAASVLASGIAGPNVAVETRRGQIYVTASLSNTIVEISSGTPVVAASGLLFPNGLAIGKDHFLYVAESVGRVTRFPIHKDGTLGPSELYVSGLAFGTDGIAFDRKGNLLVLGGGVLAIVLAGTHEIVPVPTDPLFNWPSNLAFGHGRGFRRHDTYLANFGNLLGNGTTVVRFRYNHRGIKLVR